MNLKLSRKFKPNYEDARGRGTRGDNNSFKLYSGRTRPQLQMQTFNLNFGLKINQLNSYSGRARPTSYRSIIVASTMQFTYPKIKDMSQPILLASDASRAIG
ncbi:hypothetical protein GIB67_005741 [Kingdonia uniflora]|uniref:Uncharacterized protein n=1 Tax=Kingdonia uniflora TaxID=39325 RepID=A0A7J7KVF1_9MAGN|nr:hypothetical protein GIB67_005741 [Kingdonia uniflora]